MAKRTSKASAASKTASKSSRANATFTIGIDLGGTKVAAASVSADGKVLSESRRPTVPPFMAELDLRTHADFKPTPSQVRSHVKYVIEAMADAAEECLSSVGKAPRSLAVGLASAGPMSIEKGTLIDPSNFLGWKTVPLVSLLRDELKSRKLSADVHFQNDAIAAALGEGWTGSAKGCSTYVMITVGTGIGTGVIFNGKPAQSRGMGSEWGHMIANSVGFMRDPGSFVEREVEGFASGTGIIRQARLHGLQYPSASEVAEAARNGDKEALALFAGASEALASLMYSLSLGFNPEVFCVSGGMLAIKNLFLPQAIDLYKEAMKLRSPEFLAPVKVAKLGTKAGVIGAARLPHL